MGGDPAFEGLKSRFFQAGRTFCHSFSGVNPQRPDHVSFSGILFEISSFGNTMPHFSTEVMMI